jgi:hypothetical protein
MPVIAHMTIRKYPRLIKPSTLQLAFNVTSIRLNVSRNTVKTHLSHIFAKTGVRGQAELVGLIASLRSVCGDI